MSLNGLAQNIFLLEKITPLPESPHDNPIPARLQQSESTGRTLRLDHEQSIVSALSFLSSYTDDPNGVSALCVEEKPGGKGLIINIAANSGDMEELKAGLEEIARILMKEAEDGLLAPDCRRERLD